MEEYIMNTRNQLGNWPVFRDAFTPLAELLEDWIPSAEAVRNSSRLNPACEIEEQKDHFLLSLEVPGVKKDDLKIEFVENQVIISGERKFENKSQSEGIHYTERGSGK